MNEYIVAVHVQTKNGKFLTVTEMVKANNKTEAIEKIKKTVEEEGLTYAGYDYCDWTGD